MFQSTPPARAATAFALSLGVTPEVSIHAARAGGDRRRLRGRVRASRFNPRRPRGRRQYQAALNEGIAKGFNPRRPRGRRHPVGRPARRQGKSFNPRRPRGRRLGVKDYVLENKSFNPRRPRGRRLPAAKPQKIRSLLSCFRESD